MVTWVKDFLDRYNPTTAKVNGQVLREAEVMLDKPVHEMTQDDAISYFHAISNSGKYTQKRKLSTLSAYFKYLVNRDLLSKNPMVAVRGPRVDRAATIRWLKEEEKDSLLDATEDMQERAILAAGLSGLRLSEIVSLNVEQFDDGRLWNVTGKGGKVRTVPLTSEAERLIGAHVAGRRKGPMFKCGRNRMSRRTVQNIVGRTSEAALGRRVNPHALRHTFATLAAKADVPVMKLGRILGHANPQVTEIYVHLDDTDLRDAIRVLDKPETRKTPLKLVKAKSA